MKMQLTGLVYSIETHMFKGDEGDRESLKCICESLANVKPKPFFSVVKQQFLG